MRQFDICELAATGRRNARRARLVALLQHDFLSDLGSVVVAPLLPATEDNRIQRLRPVVKLQREEYVVAVDRLAAVRRQELGPVAGSIESSSHELRNALDLLFVGF